MPANPTMKRWVIDRHGRDGLRLDEAPTPEPRPGEVRVRVGAVALNARDLMMIDHGMGLELDFPFVPASDMAGSVEALGEGVGRLRPGDRVIANFLPEWIDGRPTGSAAQPSYRTLGGHYPGVLAERVCVPEGWLVGAPASLSDVEAATLPVAGLTAWFALVDKGHVRAGETVLVPGTGGVALFATQIAAAHGAEVIITSSSDAKLKRTKALGAQHGINRDTAEVVAEVYRITGGRGADHVLDLEDLVRAVDRIGLKPVIDGRYAFKALPEALDHLARGAFGKVVVEMAAAGDGP